MKQKNLIKIIRVDIKDFGLKHCLDITYTNPDILKKLKTSESPEDQEKYKRCYQANKKYEKAKILIRESEITRIVQKLNKENLELDGGYPLKKRKQFVKDLLLVKIGSIKDYCNLAQCEKSDQGIVTFNGVRYKNLICSSSNVRCRKALFVRESMFDQVNKILLCGIPTDQPFKVFAKFNSYYGLASTDSIPVSLPKIVVVNDCKKEIKELFDVVQGDLSKQITEERGKRKKRTIVLGQGEYSVIPNQYETCDIEPFDGAGLVDVSRMARWAKELELNYLPSVVQFRAIPGVKGNFYTFDLKAFVQKLKTEGKPPIVTDCWGKTWDFERDHIDCIMTKSQFKFFDVYAELAKKKGIPTEGFKLWQDEFRKECEGYRRTFNLSEISEPLKALKDECLTSYQPLQTIELQQSEIEDLCQQTVSKVKKLHSNIDEFLHYRGLIDDGEKRKSDRIPPFYEALEANHSLYNDPYIKNKILDDLKSLKYRCYIGKLFIDGNYQVLTPDLFGLAQYAFGQEVTGLLRANEVYSHYWNKKSVKEIDIIRNPHIAHEHCPVKLVNDAQMAEWYRYQDTGIIINTYDSIALRLNSADFDGDHILTTSNDILIKAARRANANTIDWKRQDEPKENNTLIPIDNMSKIIETNAVGMSNSIGDVVNQISILWSLPQTKEIQDAIKIMSVIGSLTIDFAKTGEAADIPYDIKQMLKKIQKPLWMKYRHKTDMSRDNAVMANSKTFGLSDDAIKLKRPFEYRPDCTMQKISDYMIKEIDQLKLDFEQIGEFDFTNLIVEKVNPYSQTYVHLKAKLIELQRDHQIISNKVFRSEEIEGNSKSDDNSMTYQLFFDHCRTELLLSCRGSNRISKVVDCLIWMSYKEKKFVRANKSILWNAFAEEMLQRSKGQLEIKEFDRATLKAKAKKSREKIESLKASKYIVKLKPFENMDDITFDISKNEIHQIKKLLPKQIPEQRLLLILLGIFRKAQNKPFKFGRVQKQIINQSQICKLARFDKDGKQFKKSLQALMNQKLIEIDPSKSIEQPMITVLTDKIFKDIVPDSDNKNSFSDINDYAKFIDSCFRGKPLKNKPK